MPGRPLAIPLADRTDQPSVGDAKGERPDESQAISPTAEPGRGGRRFTRGTPS